jgi:sirohydrochlorin cobaltochelatase
MNSCLVLLAHGSKNPNWVKPFEKLASDLKQDVGEEKVFLCFMEHATPSLHQVTQQLFNSGIQHFRVLPLFMASGNHLQQDIPAQIAGLRSQFPELEIELLSPIGEHPLFLDLMHRIAQQCIGDATPLPGLVRLEPLGKTQGIR